MTQTEIPNRLYTANQVNQLDHVAINSFGYSGSELMQNAGVSLARLILARFDDPGNVVVLCGAGNNGGDGYVIASTLNQQDVTVFVVQVAPPLSQEAREKAAHYRQAGGKFLEPENLTAMQPGIVVDALLGSGINRPPQDQYAELIIWSNRQPCPVVSVDIPSGLNGGTGVAWQPAICADLTMSFIAMKTGLLTADGPDHCGEIIVETLSIEEAVYQQITPVAFLSSRPSFARRKRNSHKGNFGNVLIAGGDIGMMGAIMLAAKAALRSGAGLVNVYTRSSHAGLVTVNQPELMSHGETEHSTGNDTSDHQLDRLLKNATSLVLGPGTTDNDWGRRLFDRAVQSDVPRIIDAGALRILSSTTLHSNNQILTPHPGEAAALLGISTTEVQKDRIAAAQNIAKQYGGVCVLKGVGTVITNGNKTEICDRGNAGMASAGMGDVLSGIAGAQAAVCSNLFDAANQAVWLHAVSGDSASQKTGESSLIASDVIDALPAVIQRCTTTVGDTPSG